MANQYKNKVIYNGTTLMDISDTTAIASDVGLGKEFYTASGAKAQGTAVTGNAISVVDTTDSNGGTIRTITAVDISDTTAVAADVASGKYFYTANGTKTAGTASGGGGSSAILITKTINANGTYNAQDDSADGYSSVTVNVPTSGGSIPTATKHTIHFEFTDETDTDIDVYYDDTLLNTMIQAYAPVRYNSKLVALAQLDGITWFNPANIPLNTELIDISAAEIEYSVGDDGSKEASPYNTISDYTLIDPSMTFSYTCMRWSNYAYYDENHNVISVITAAEDIDSYDEGGNIGYGTLSPAKIPSNARYVRFTGGYRASDNTTLSLIRTA